MKIFRYKDVLSGINKIFSALADILRENYLSSISKVNKLLLIYLEVKIVRKKNLIYCLISSNLLRKMNRALRNDSVYVNEKVEFMNTIRCTSKRIEDCCLFESYFYNHFNVCYENISVFMIRI